MYAAPKLWNNLPLFVRKSATVNEFKTRLKTHLLYCNENYACFVWTIVMRSRVYIIIVAAHYKCPILLLLLLKQTDVLVSVSHNEQYSHSYRHCKQAKWLFNHAFIQLCNHSSLMLYNISLFYTCTIDTLTRSQEILFVILGIFLRF